MRHPEYPRILKDLMSLVTPEKMAGKLIEEMSELTKELVKHFIWQSPRAVAVVEEMVDVKIMLDQLTMLMMEEMHVNKEDMILLMDTIETFKIIRVANREGVKTGPPKEK